MCQVLLTLGLAAELGGVGWDSAIGKGSGSLKISQSKLEGCYSQAEKGDHVRGVSGLSRAHLPATVSTLLPSCTPIACLLCGQRASYPLLFHITVV